MRIYMEVAQAQALLSRLEGMAERSEQIGRSVDQALRSLENVWYGPAPTQYYHIQRRYLERLQKANLELRELARLLHREIAEYLRVAGTLG